MSIHKLSGKPTASMPISMREEVNYSKITLVGKTDILFVWTDELSEYSERSTTSGIALQSKLNKNRPRVGIIKCVGADSELSPGQFIILSEIREPYGVNIGNLEHWRCRYIEVDLVSDEYPIFN